MHKYRYAVIIIPRFSAGKHVQESHVEIYHYKQQPPRDENGLGKVLCSITCGLTNNLEEDGESNLTRKDLKH